MSKEAKNEIDLMLRQLGRRDGGVLLDSAQQHLDADELNSYVANALPAAARTRYMEHLADCASCRRLVAQLSAAQGPVVVEHARNVPVPSALKQFLASLFSPMVLRYAVPALGLIVAMVIGVVMLRREPQPDSLARVVDVEQNKSVNVPASQSSPTTADGLVDQSKLNDSATPKPSRGQSEPEAVARKDQPAAPVTATEQPAAGLFQVQPLEKSAASEAPPPPKVVVTQAEDKERRADSEKKAEADVVSRAKMAEATARREEQNKAPQPQTIVTGASDAAANRKPEVVRLAPGVAGAGTQTRRARDEGSDNRTAKDDDATKDKNEAAETRSVAGRRFRKSGNIWVDTAYSPPQRTFDMTRGSEQYRTLVADEPDIRKIADELDGEFIVVWKGRAYHIR